jgi:hypothetical protein
MFKPSSEATWKLGSESMQGLRPDKHGSPLCVLQPSSPYNGCVTLSTRTCVHQDQLCRVSPRVISLLTASGFSFYAGPTRFPIPTLNETQRGSQPDACGSAIAFEPQSDFSNGKPYDVHRTLVTTAAANDRLLSHRPKAVIPHSEGRGLGTIRALHKTQTKTSQ